VTTRIAMREYDVAWSSYGGPPTRGSASIEIHRVLLLGTRAKRLAETIALW
jgi:hypothetical protein